MTGDRHDGDITDRGLRFDLSTVMRRRHVLKLFGVGGLALTGLRQCGCEPACTPAPGTCTEIPDETAGPYPADGSNGPNALSTSGIVRRDITSSFGSASGVATGVPLTIDLTLTDVATGCAALAGAAVYLWHCDREGRYSMYSAGVTGENYLRGVQESAADGTLRFTSIFPACYSGRWPHIHFEVYPNLAAATGSANAVTTSQLALPEDACRAVYATTGYEASVANLNQVTLTTDNVFSDGVTQQLATVIGSVETGYTASLTVPVDQTTAPSGGAAPGGGGTPPGGATPPGPPPTP